MIEWGSDWFVHWDLQSAGVRLLLWMIAAAAFFAIIFAILILRQAKRMSTVLPTPLTPVSRLMAVGYLVFTVVVLGLVVNYLV